MAQRKAVPFDEAMEVRLCPSGKIAAVTDATHRLLQEALTLGPDERAALAAELLVSLDESRNDEQSAWVTETERRSRIAVETRREDGRDGLEVAGEWPEGFFEEVVGGWKGEPLDRPEQGQAERRDRL